MNAESLTIYHTTLKELPMKKEKSRCLTLEDVVTVGGNLAVHIPGHVFTKHERPSFVHFKLLHLTSMKKES